MRNALFQLFLPVWTTLNLLLFMPVLLMSRKWVVRIQTLWAIVNMWFLKHVAGISYEIRGIENLPPGGCVVASKHQSAWDTMIWHIIVHDPAMVMKKELLDIPVYGWFATKAKMIPVDRKAGAAALKNMMRAAEEAAAMGRPVVIFPEGTRTAPGQRIPYQPGVTALYRHLKLPAVPVAVNSGLFWGKKGLSGEGGTIVLEFGPPIPAGLGKKEFISTLEEKVEAATDRLVAEHRQKTGASSI